MLLTGSRSSRHRHVSCTRRHRSRTILRRAGWALCALLVVPRSVLSAANVRQIAGPERMGLPEGIAFVRVDAVLVANRAVPGVTLVQLGPGDATSLGRFGTGPLAFQDPIDVAVAREEWYCLDRIARRITVLAEGSVQREIDLVSGKDSVGEPVAIDVLPDGRLLVLDASHANVRVHAASGALLARIGESGRGDEAMWCPHDLTMGPDGVIYVADSGNRRIQRYTLDGRCLGPWGSYGVGPARFLDPAGVAIALDGSLLVADRYAHRIQVLSTPTGEEILERRLELQDIFRYPSRLVALPDGRCIVTSTQLSAVWELPCP